jgi:transcriptional regulator with XRE-family HTH domain
VDAARTLHLARGRAGLTQRRLAAIVGIPQSVVARIESGRTVPRVDTLDRLLAGCGETLEARPRIGAGVDRTQIRELLRLTPGQRAGLAVREATNLDAIRPRAR